MKNLIKQGMFEIIKEKAKTKAQHYQKPRQRKIISDNCWQHNEFVYLSSQTSILVTTLKRWFAGTQELQEGTQEKILDFLNLKTWEEFENQALIYRLRVINK